MEGDLAGFMCLKEGFERLIEGLLHFRTGVTSMSEIWMTAIVGTDLAISARPLAVVRSR